MPELVGEVLCFQGQEIAQLLKEAVRFLRNDKKAKGGELRLALPAEIGRVVIKTAPLKHVEEFLEKS